LEQSTSSKGPEQANKPEQASRSAILEAIDNSLQTLIRLNEKDQDQLADLIARVYSQILSKRAQNRVAEQVGIKQPDQPVVNYVWRVIITCFAAGLIVSVITLAIGLLLGRQANELQIMLTVFTTVAAYFAGLLSPSPTHNK
jgi:hypothetical protein